MNEQSSLLSPTVILVTGPPRSGTSMLAGALSSGEAHPLLPECQVITDIIRERIRSENEISPAKFEVFLKDSVFADSIYRFAIQTILSQIITSGSNSKFLVLKDPSLIFYMDVVDRFFSWPVRKICIVRDPRDAVSSFISVRMREGVRPGIGEAIHFFEPYYCSLLNIEVGEDNPLIVRYEDLARRKGNVEALICNHIGYEVDFRNYGGLTAEELDSQDPWCTPLYGAPISDSSIKSYEKVISPDEFHLLNNVFGPVLERFYSVSS